MDGGAWWATVHGVTNSRTRLSDFTFTIPYTKINPRHIQDLNVVKLDFLDNSKKMPERQLYDPRKEFLNK